MVSAMQSHEFGFGLETMEFIYGIQEQGHRNYEHMAFHLEDCIDYLIVPYHEYDFLFLFHHLCGLDKQRGDGLNEEIMMKQLGGK